MHGPRDEEAGTACHLEEVREPTSLGLEVTPG